jgi:hypothetical protein
MKDDARAGIAPEMGRSKRMNEPNLEPSFRWADKIKARKAEITELFNAPTFKDIFSDKFVEGLERRRELLEGRSHKVQVAQLLILIMLAMALLSLHLTVSIFGLSTADTRNLREVLLVVSSTVQLFNLFSIREQMYIREFLEVYINKLSKGNDIARRALRIRYGLGHGFDSPWTFEGKKPKRRHLIVLLATLIGLLGWILMALVCAITIQIAAMFDILRDPTISIGWSLVVVIYVLIVDAATFGIQAMGGGFSSVSQEGQSSS